MSKSSELKKQQKILDKEANCLHDLMDTFNQPELMIRLKVYRIYSIFALHNDDVQDIQDGTRYYWEQVNASGNRSRTFVQEQIARFRTTSNSICNVQPRIESRSCDAELPKIGKMVRQQIEQTIRTCNFKARNDRIETGVVVKSHKGRNVSAEGKV